MWWQGSATRAALGGRHQPWYATASDAQADATRPSGESLAKTQPGLRYRGRCEIDLYLLAAWNFTAESLAANANPIQ